MRLASFIDDIKHTIFNLLDFSLFSHLVLQSRGRISNIDTMPAGPVSLIICSNLFKVFLDSRRFE